MARIFLNRFRASVVAVLVTASLALATSAASIHPRAIAFAAQAPVLSKVDFEIIEGIFHDGLGTYAELMLANELIRLAELSQPLFDPASSRAKMLGAIDKLPASHESRARFKQEIANIEQAARLGAAALINQTRPASLARVRHVPREFADAKAGDLVMEFHGREPLPVSVKTDKSGKVAVAEGQTPDIEAKWAERYFRVSPQEMDQMIRELGFSSMTEIKSEYLNVAELVAHILIRRLGLKDCRPTDFSKARITDLDALKYLLHQLLYFKRGNDRSRVIIFDRSTGRVKWESLLDGVNIDNLTAGQVGFLPSHPRENHRIASEFGIRIDGSTIVSFQIKHRRGTSRGTIHQYEFSDITTRLRI